MKNLRPLLSIFLFILLFSTIFNVFSAESLKKEELSYVFLKINIYTMDSQKITLTENDNISIYNEENNLQTFSIKDGSLLLEIPLYDYDSEISSNTRKSVTIDNNVHKTIVLPSTYLDVNSANVLAYKNENPLKTEFDNYSVSLDNYQGCILEWSLSRELDQTYVNDDYNLHLILSSEPLQKETEEILLEGNDNVPNFVSPCDYDNVEIKDFDNGKYLQFIPISNEIYSIATGDVIEFNDIDNYIVIKYNEGLAIKYDNIILTNRNTTIEQGEIIGYSNCLNLYCLDNSEYIAAEWLIDGFERPEEGPNLPRIYQNDSRWNNITYGYSTIGDGGCGPTSFSMVLSGLKHITYTPDQIVNTLNSMGDGIWYYKQGEGSYYTIFPKLAEYYELNIDDSINTSEDSLKKYLNEGKIIIVSLSKGNVYKGNGHFIVIRGIDANGNFLINDSANCFDLNTGYSYSDLQPIKSAQAFW